MTEFCMFRTGLKGARTHAPIAHAMIVVLGVFRFHAGVDAAQGLADELHPHD